MKCDLCGKEIEGKPVTEYGDNYHEKCWAGYQRIRIKEILAKQQ